MERNHLTQNWKIIGVCFEGATGGPGVQTLKRNFPLKHKTVGPVSLSPLWCPLSPLAHPPASGACFIFIAWTITNYIPFTCNMGEEGGRLSPQRRRRRRQHGRILRIANKSFNSKLLYPSFGFTWLMKVFSIQSASFKYFESAQDAFSWTQIKYWKRFLLYKGSPPLPKESFIIQTFNFIYLRFWINFSI